VVLEECHVGRAAERLNLTPSAVSHGLGRLRQLLNDPLFLRTPKGVVPTARATELAEPIADILARVRRVVATAEPFDAARSTRRFALGAPDALSAVILPGLLARLQREAPGIDLSVRQILPPALGRLAGRPWETALADLEARHLDIAVLPIDDVPPRFAERILFEEEFVIAMRRGHAFAQAPTLEHYCRLSHIVVSLTRDDSGFVDWALAEKGLSRRVALAVPNFMLALGLLAETDLVAAMPRSLISRQAERFGLVFAEAPLPLRSFTIRVVATRAAMMDAAVAWLFGMVG
jgi:DNA-binding transcriptional LysR family regulator